jgi:hypothetical protein
VEEPRCAETGERRGDTTAQCSRGVETVVDSLVEDHPRSIWGRVERTTGGDVVSVVEMGVQSSFGIVVVRGLATVVKRR